MNQDRDIEQALQRGALRPSDDEFTRRVLDALPPRARSSRAARLRSFALATRLGLLLALIAGVQRWLAAEPAQAESVIAAALFLAPTLAAVALVCGPWFPGAAWRSLRRLPRFRP